MENNGKTSAQHEYVLVTGLEADWTYFNREILIAPADVVRAFGRGSRSDECKVSQEWVFRKGKLIFTLYDWKSTSLCNRNLQTPEAFWSMTDVFPLHIGSKAPAVSSDLDRFVRYLMDMTSHEVD